LYEDDIDIELSDRFIPTRKFIRR